jgi:hypothetical protein
MIYWIKFLCKSTGKVQKEAGKTQTANCDFKIDLQKLWMGF